MTNDDPRFVADHIRHDLRQLWETRAIFALRFAPGCPMDTSRLVAILVAALGPASVLGELKPGTIRLNALGDNAKITLERKVISRHVFSGKDMGEREVCTVDDLNRGLGWIMKQIDATDEEYTTIVNKIAGWIARDESQIGLHVERMRDSATVNKGTREV
jgi:hypothetical protein